MRRSKQIVSACAFILVATGAGTGVSDGLAAEGEKLPCNHLCQTWMGYESGARVAPVVRSDETATGKPSEVQPDPEFAVDHTMTNVDPATDSGDRLHHPKPKRKGERDTAAGSNRRSLATRSKTSKLAKSLGGHDDVLSDGLSDPESSRNKPPGQAEEIDRKSPVIRGETSSGPAKALARDVPLPPRLPRDARPERRGVAQADPIAAGQIRAKVADEQQAKPTTKADVTAGPARKNAAERDVSHPATGSKMAVAARPAAKTAAIDSDGAAEGLAVARTPGLSVMPAIDPRGAVLGATREAPSGETPESTKSSAPQTHAVAGPVIEGAPKVGDVAHVSDPSGSAVTAKVDALPPAFAATGEAASKTLPIRVGQEPAVAIDRPAAPSSLLSAGRADMPGSGLDKDGAKVAPKAEAPPSPSLEVTAKNPLQSAFKGSAVSAADTTVVVPSVPASRTVGPASDTDKQAAQVIPPAEAPPASAGTSGRAASINSPKTVEQGSRVTADAAAKSDASSATTSIGAARAGDHDGIARPAPAPSTPPARAASAAEAAVPEQASVYPAATHVAALNDGQTMSAPRVSQSPVALPSADGKAAQPGPSNAVRAPISSGDVSLGNGDAHRPNPGETASMVMAPPPAATSDNPATLVTIAVNDVSSQREKTTIGYTITNLAASHVDILFIRCNAVDPRGTILGSVFDYVVNIPAGQVIKRSVHMSSDFGAGPTFSCANDAATH